MSHQNTPSDADRHQTYRGMSAPYQSPPLGARDHARYRLGSRLGHSGQMYEAQSTRYAGQLIVRLFPLASGLAPAVAGFTGEAAKVAGLRHPHIAQVFHAGTFADGTPFLAMERLSGQTLEQRIGGRGALPISELLPVVRGIASALSAAHGIGIIHRELRAENVFISDLTGYELGFAKVLDFGVSRLTAAALAAGRIVPPGTLRTLAPEQRQTTVDKADERSDQFALAALTYRLLTGVEPQQDSGPAFERTQRPRPSTSLAPCTPAAEAVLTKALSKRPENRYDSVALFFRAIEEALGSNPVHVSTPGFLPEPDVAETAIGDRWVEPERGADRFDSPTVRVDISRMEVAPTGESAEHASVTQQFFVEGDRQEAANWENSALVEADGPARDSVTFDSFDRVPKRRTPLVFAALIVAAGLGIAAWSTGLGTPRAPLAPIVERNPSVAAIPVPSPAIAPPAVPGPSATTQATTARSATAPILRALSTAPGSVRMSTRRAIPAALQEEAVDRVPVDKVPMAPDDPAAGEVGARSLPLRGYVWSPARRRLVQVRPAPVPTDWLAPPGDSGPPPVPADSVPARQSVNP
jgi:serine/threonine protein kinase